MKILLFLGLLITYHLSLITPTFAQGFNIASTYQIDDEEALSGDILVATLDKGIVRTNITYDHRIFGILQDNPLVVLKEATSSARPVIRAGDTLVNISDFNGELKKGDLVTTSPLLGKGMKAGQSGYVLGVATADNELSGQPTTVEGKQVRTGTVAIAIKIEYAELTTARNTISLLNDLNAALFRNIQNPEKFTIVIRYIIGGFIALLAFAIGFFWVSRSVSKAVEAIGRNPLAKKAILLSVAFHIGLTLVAGAATVAIIFIIIRLWALPFSAILNLGSRL